MAIHKCTCDHTSQDELNGKNNRICNPTTKGSVRCTVCKKEHLQSQAEKKVKEKK